MTPDADPPERKPPRGLASSGSTTSTRRYSVWVGVVFVAVAIIAAVNTISTQEGALLGTDPSQRGTPLPLFAVPEALASLEGDANVFQDDCASSRNPCPAEDRRTPACEVEGADVIRVCDFFERPLVLSFWFTRGGDCLPTQDAVAELAERYRGRVSFLSVNVRDEREQVRQIISERGWEIPVGYDADGAVSNLYRVGVCPTVAFAYPGGILAGAAVGADELTPANLRNRIEDLIRTSRGRARRDR